MHAMSWFSARNRESRVKWSGFRSAAVADGRPRMELTSKSSVQTLIQTRNLRSLVSPFQRLEDNSPNRQRPRQPRPRIL